MLIAHIVKGYASLLTLVLTQYEDQLIQRKRFNVSGL